MSDLHAILKIVVENPEQERSKIKLLCIYLAIQSGAHIAFNTEGKPVSNVELLMDAASRLEDYFDASQQEEGNDE